MRKAAGILMIIYGVTTVGFYVDYGMVLFSPFNFLVFTPLLTFLSVVPIITGGVCCLKRKYWKICFGSSLFLLLFMILFFLSLRYPLAIYPSPRLTWLTWVTYLLITMGVLPQIFIYLRKSDWREISV